MTSLRSLLRLEDKVAAEGRRLVAIGGPPLGHILPALIVAVIVLHGAVLFLPALKTRATLPASSPPQDFPLVWRMASPAVRAVHPDGAAEAPSVGPRPASSTAIARARRQVMEPVPEPSSDLASSALAVEVDAVIPPPDAPPPGLEPLAPTSPAPITSEAEPVLIRSAPPVYPPPARALRAEARVTVRLTLGADGAVDDAAVLGCSRPNLGFETAALNAVMRWRYTPQSPNSGPRSVIVTVDFKREGDRP